MSGEGSRRVRFAPVQEAECAVGVRGTEWLHPLKVLYRGGGGDCFFCVVAAALSELPDVDATADSLRAEVREYAYKNTDYDIALTDLVDVHFQVPSPEFEDARKDTMDTILRKGVFADAYAARVLSDMYNVRIYYMDSRDRTVRACISPRGNAPNHVVVLHHDRGVHFNHVVQCMSDGTERGVFTPDNMPPKIVAMVAENPECAADVTFPPIKRPLKPPSPVTRPQGAHSPQETKPSSGVSSPTTASAWNTSAGAIVDEVDRKWGELYTAQEVYLAAAEASQEHRAVAAQNFEEAIRNVDGIAGTLRRAEALHDTFIGMYNNTFDTKPAVFGTRVLPFADDIHDAVYKLIRPIEDS